ncbi:Voltage-Dependent L-Type Calcium Channel Subunit Alpha-1S [Manis pentadactyla]|nr:Voltage-Dependent L-Type Calcium Channel Subunit Alpha-1S [Manis pentadactyla]
MSTSHCSQSWYFTFTVQTHTILGRVVPSPAAARGADACPTTVLSQSGSSSGPRLQASPPPCERPARPASAAEDERLLGHQH